MDCESCSMEGTSGEATIKCTECGDWMCDLHTHFRPDGTALCPSCHEHEEAELEQSPADLQEDTGEEP